MRYAKAQNTTTTEDIFSFINNLNEDSETPLLNNEVYKIAKSVFKYWTNDSILYGISQKETNINDGAMDFPKMSNLTKSEYDEETKRRQKLAAKYAIEKRDKEKNKEQLKKTRVEYIERKNIEMKR